jgi:hypothetical protein
LRPVQQAALQAREASVHQRADQADHQDAEEHQVEHEQLAAPDHQVADAFAGGQQLHRQQRRPAGGQGQAHAGEKGGQGSWQQQAQEQQVRGQAQGGGGFAQLGWASRTPTRVCRVTGTTTALTSTTSLSTRQCRRTA